MSPKKYSNLGVWICRWFYLVEYWTVCLCIIFSGAQSILSSVSLRKDDFVANKWQVILTFRVVIGIAILVNVFGAKHLDLINKICIYWTAASVAVLICTILSLSKDFRSAHFVFRHFDDSQSGWSAFSWFVGPLQSH